MLAVIDERTPQNICNELKRRGFSLLPLPSYPALPSPVASHPDMLLFFAKDRILCTKEYAKIAKKELGQLSIVSGKPIYTVEETVSEHYPHDILFNAAPVGAHLFCYPAYTAKALTEDSDYTVCPVRQGYAKCSTIPVGNHALITADPSIVKAAIKVGVDVLQIAPAHVTLTGYDTGFLGGATSFAPYTDLHEIYFCGALQNHPNAREIAEFCKRHQKTAISLSDGPLFDLGTVFLI